MWPIIRISIWIYIIRIPPARSGLYRIRVYRYGVYINIMLMYHNILILINGMAFMLGLAQVSAHNAGPHGCGCILYSLYTYNIFHYIFLYRKPPHHVDLPPFVRRRHRGHARSQISINIYGTRPGSGTHTSIISIFNIIRDLDYIMLSTPNKYSSI